MRELISLSSISFSLVAFEEIEDECRLLSDRAWHAGDAIIFFGSSSPENDYYMAARNFSGELVGLLEIQQTGEGKAAIQAAVVPEYQRQGIGQQLLDASMLFAKDNNLVLFAQVKPGTKGEKLIKSNPKWKLDRRDGYSLLDVVDGRWDLRRKIYRFKPE